MKLIIHEQGDLSVGMPERWYEIECPFEKDEVWSSDLSNFKDRMKAIYAEYAEMKVTAFYDFEKSIA